MNNNRPYSSEVPFQTCPSGIRCDGHLILDGNFNDLCHILGGFRMNDNGVIRD